MGFDWVRLRAFVALPLLFTAAPGQAEDQPPISQPIVVTAQLPLLPPDLAGTVPLPVRAERFADNWERARRDAFGHPRLKQLVESARGLPRQQQLAFVQAEVHRRIRWISDATEWGAHDYWASAAETLSQGAGDAEDRAIVKMQALKALGIPARDLFLTMGRDRVAGPVTVLVVRLDGVLYLLDDTGGRPFAAVERPDFEPVLTLGHGGSWLHGRRARTAMTTAAALAVTAKP